MNSTNKNPFELAKCEITKLDNFDVITASQPIIGGFEGEEEEFLF